MYATRGWNFSCDQKCIFDKSWSYPRYFGLHQLAKCEGKKLEVKLSTQSLKIKRRGGTQKLLDYFFPFSVLSIHV